MRCKRSLCPSRRACHSAGVAKSPRWMRRLPLPNRMARLLMAPSRQLWSRSAVTSWRFRPSTFPPAGCESCSPNGTTGWSRTIPALRHPPLVQHAPSAQTVMQDATSSVALCNTCVKLFAPARLRQEFSYTLGRVGATGALHEDVAEYLDTPEEPAELLPYQ